MQERVRDIRYARKPCRKPTLEECVAILDEAASLPPPEQAPGGADTILCWCQIMMFLELLVCYLSCSSQAR